MKAYRKLIIIQTWLRWKMSPGMLYVSSSLFLWRKELIWTLPSNKSYRLLLLLPFVLESITNTALILDNLLLNFPAQPYIWAHVLFKSWIHSSFLHSLSVEKTKVLAKWCPENGNWPVSFDSRKQILFILKLLQRRWYNITEQKILFYILKTLDSK